MDISFFLIIGFLTAGLLAYYPKRTSLLLTILYWSIPFLWSLDIFKPFTFQPLDWVGFFGIHLSYHPDGLTKLFALMISGIGILVFIYAQIYTQNEKAKRPKLLSLLQLFAVSMFGIVISDDMILLFVFWELTSIISYLLIQFKVEDDSANQAAFNGLFISVAGGLSMLVGFVILHTLSATWSISESIAQASLLTHSSGFTAAFLLVFVGAITKSAQFPFYFWLTGAMKAPTPVSTYLHSATMVNAGLYLLARFHPLFNDSSLWYPLLAFFGLSTMLVSSILSLLQEDLKAVLAYTTIFALGAMLYLLGGDHPLIIEAFAIFFLFHAIYKAAAFMMVGVIDQEYETRKLPEVKGAARKSLALAIISIIVLGAMAGLPPFFGFTIKEMIYEAKLSSPGLSYFLIGCSILSSMLIAAASLRCAWFLFRKPDKSLVQKNKIKWGFICPGILASLILLLNFLEEGLQDLVEPTIEAVLPIEKLVYLSPNILGVSYQLSLLTMFGGIAISFLLMIKKPFVWWPHALNPRLVFEKTLNAFLGFGKKITQMTQEQSLSRQLMILFFFTVILLAPFLPLSNLYTSTAALNFSSNPLNFITCIFLIASAISLLVASKFLYQLIALGLIGLLVSFLFMVNGAVDLAMTQLLVEVLTIIVLLIALRNLDMASYEKKALNNGFKIGISLAVGLLTTALLVLVNHNDFNTELSHYYIANSSLLAHGKNVVNVILVDFRSFDTFGEVIVVISTAIGISLIVPKKNSIVSSAFDSSIILKSFCVFLLQILLILSVVFLLRGHNYPGGGFIAALIASTGVGFYILSYKKLPSFINDRNTLLIGLGVLCLILSLFIAVFFQKSLLTGMWWTPQFGSTQFKLGTPLLFDLGIYLCILGSIVWLVTTLERNKYA